MSNISFGVEIVDFDFFVTPSNIHWNYEMVPKNISTCQVYKKWKNSLYSENPPIRWSPVHLTSNESSEVIIQEMVGGTGGLNTLVVQFKGENCIKLTEIFGGFIFFHTPSKNHTLIVYERFGAEYRNVEYKLVGNSYKQISVKEIPQELSGRNHQDDMFYHFWFMTNGTIKNTPKY